MRAMAQERRVAATRPGRGASVKGFFRDAWLELLKVIWPTREEVTKMTGLVVAVVIVVGLFIFVWDQVLVGVTRPLFPS